MRIRYGVSPWIHTFPDSRRPSYPRLKGELTTTVVVVGGGLTGSAVAYACAAAGIRAVMIEAERVGQGSAGRSAGLLIPDPGPSFRTIAGLHGLRAAKRIFEALRRASVDGSALLRRLKIKCALEPHDAAWVAFRDDEKALRREYEARLEAGFDTTWLAQKQVRRLTAFDAAAAAMRQPHAFALDPYRAALGLTSAAVRRGTKVFEQSQVAKVRFSRRNVEVMVEGGMVRAETVIVTTGSATPEFKPLRRHFKRRDTYLVLTEPVPAVMRKQLGDPDIVLRDLRVPNHRIRWTRDDRLLVAGADQEEVPARKRQDVLVQRTGQLMYELLTMNPAISGLQPEYGWDLRYGETADGLMYIGPHRNYPRHLFALGGSDVTAADAFLAARVLLRAVRGEPQKGDEVFGWTR